MAKDSSFSAPFPNRTKKHARKKRHAKKTQEEEDDAAAAPRYDAPRPTRRRSIVLRLVSKSLSLRERERERTERSLVLGGKSFSLSSRDENSIASERENDKTRRAYGKNERKTSSRTHRRKCVFSHPIRETTTEEEQKNKEREGKSRPFLLFFTTNKRVKTREEDFLLDKKKNQTLHKIGVLYIHTYSV